MPNRITDIVRQLRRLQTPEEHELWERLRNRKLRRMKFLRQHPIVYSHVEGNLQFFVADFYCAEKKLVIELDGKIHDFQKDYDANRDAILKALDLQVLRIKNEELTNVYSVLKKITNLTHPPAPSLQSREGVVERSETGGEFKLEEANTEKSKYLREFALLVLAAGPSSRMGQSKQLLLVENEPLLQKTVNVALQAALGKVVVVLGAEATEHQEVLKGLPVDTVVNNNWQDGMGSSLKAGMKYMSEKLPNCEAVIILVCDQPYLTAGHLQQLTAKFLATGKPIIASGYANTLGVPCLFAKGYFEELLAIGDDEGAKKLIQKFSNDVESVPFLKGEIDLDTPDDYKIFRGI
jgi:molybdenum cofactor cytidylyltransferase